MAVRVNVGGLVRLAVAGALVLFWSTLLLITVAAKRLRKGAGVLQPRQKPRPRCLDDPQLGTHRFVKVNGIQLHYVESGDKTKPMMVLLHGFPAFWYCWHGQIKDFQKDYWVVAVDMRGYGQSDKPAGREHYAIDQLAEDVSSLVQALGRHSCVLVGHDWGGFIACRVAELRPNVVDRLVVINAGTKHGFELVLQQSWAQLLRSWYIYVFQLPWLPETMFACDELSTLDNMFSAGSVAAPERFPRELVDAFKYAFSAPGALTPPINYYRANFSLDTLYSAPAPAARITCPVLVVWGEKDTALTTLVATTPARTADRFTLRLLPQASHWSMMEFPDGVNGHIREFLRREE